MGQIMLDVGMALVQSARGRFVAIAFFRHRQADDLDSRIAHRVDDGSRVFPCHQHIVDHADHMRCFAVWPKLDGGIGEILGASASRWSGRIRLTPIMPQSPPDFSMACSI